MIIPRVGLAAVNYKGNIWVAGGLTSYRRTSVITKSVEYYNIANNHWTRINDLRIPR